MAAKVSSPSQAATATEAFQRTRQGASDKASSA
jgi:hypothetical protein